MEVGLALTLCGLGVAFWIPAIILGVILKNRTQKCTADAQAKVVRINVHNSSDSGLQYHPVYEYYAAGEYYTSEGAYLSGRVPEVGETIWIKYNPDKPKQSYIPGYDDKVYKILTIVFGLIGVVPILVCIGIAIWVG